MAHENGRPRGRGGVLVALRAALAAALLGVLVSHAGAADVARSLGRVTPAALVAALAAFLGVLLLGALRMRTLLCAAGHPIGLARAFVAQAACLAVNRIVPSTLGGDAARAALLARAGVPAPAAAAALVVDRVTGLAVLLAVALAAASVARQDAPDPVLDGVQAALLVALSGLAGVVAAGLAASGRLAHWRFVAALRAWPGRLGAVFATAALAVVSQALVVTAFALIARSVGLALPWAQLAIAVPLFLAAGAIPLTPAGLGVREGFFVWWFVRRGEDPSAVLAVPAVWLAVSIAWSAAGGVLLVRESVRRTA